MKKIAAFIILIALFSVTLTSCGLFDPTDEALAVTISEKTVKNIYDLDDELSPKATVIVSYKSGKQVETTLKENMCVGFNTHTTGKKTFYAVFENVRSADFSYTVRYKRNEGAEITTEARLSSTVGYNLGTVSYRLSIYLGELECVKGISFAFRSLSENSGFGVEPDGMNIGAAFVNLDAPKIESYVISEGCFLIFAVTYDDKPITSDDKTPTVFADVNITKGNSVYFELCNIVVSDGVNDYKLPDFVYA